MCLIQALVTGAVLYVLVDLVVELIKHNLPSKKTDQSFEGQPSER